jgi:hypothetical protein
VQRKAAGQPISPISMRHLRRRMCRSAPRIPRKNAIPASRAGAAGGSEINRLRGGGHAAGTTLDEADRLAQTGGELRPPHNDFDFEVRWADDAARLTVARLPAIGLGRAGAGGAPAQRRSCWAPVSVISSHLRVNGTGPDCPTR